MFRVKTSNVQKVAKEEKSIKGSFKLKVQLKNNLLGAINIVVFLLLNYANMNVIQKV